MTETVDGSGTHSFMIGVLLDGFPIYGPQGVGGRIVTNADLDQCSGHAGPTPELSTGIDHYHLTTTEAPYSIDCYRGGVDAAVMQRGQGQRPDLADIAAKLAVGQHDLMDALGDQPPPDFDAMSKILGMPAETIRNAFGAPPGP